MRRETASNFSKQCILIYEDVFRVEKITI